MIRYITSSEGIICWFIFMQLKTIVVCTFLSTFRTICPRIAHACDRVNKSVNFEQRMISTFIIHEKSIFSHSQSQYPSRRMINHWFIGLWFNIRKVYLCIVSVAWLMSRVHLTISHIFDLSRKFIVIDMVDTVEMAILTDASSSSVKYDTDFKKSLHVY